MPTADVSDDTRAMLLLGGRLRRAQPDLEPLPPRQVAELAGWLQRQEYRPADLLARDTAEWSDDPFLPLPPERLIGLLADRAGLDAALQSWASSGLWVITAWDEEYPARLAALGRHAPPLLFGAGDAALLTDGGLAAVGSRDADEGALAFCADLAAACAGQGLTIVSGGARGVDAAAMNGGVEAGGRVVGVLAADLARTASRAALREPLAEGHLTLVSPFSPEAGFDPGNAMGRNKYIYALADAAVVACSATGSGGTWTGAVEALKRGDRPVYFRREGLDAQGRTALAELGARLWPDDATDDLTALLRPNL